MTNINKLRSELLDVTINSSSNFKSIKKENKYKDFLKVPSFGYEYSSNKFNKDYKLRNFIKISGYIPGIGIIFGIIKLVLCSSTSTEYNKKSLATRAVVEILGLGCLFIFVDVVLNRRRDLHYKAIKIKDLKNVSTLEVADKIGSFSEKISLLIGNRLGKGGFKTVSRCYFLEKEGKEDYRRLAYVKMNNPLDTFRVNEEEKTFEIQNNLREKGVITPKIWTVTHEDKDGKSQKGYLMEQYEMDLSDQLGKKNDNASLLDMMAQVTDLVAKVNENGYAHKDIKPENFLVKTNADTGKREVAITDFGLCIEKGRVSNPCQGTSGYIHPDNNNVTPIASDAYALGKTLEGMKKSLKLKNNKKNKALASYLGKLIGYLAPEKDYKSFINAEKGSTGIKLIQDWYKASSNKSEKRGERVEEFFKNILI